MAYCRSFDNTHGAALGIDQEVRVQVESCICTIGVRRSLRVAHLEQQELASSTIIAAEVFYWNNRSSMSPLLARLVSTGVAE